MVPALSLRAMGHAREREELRRDLRTLEGALRRVCGDWTPGAVGSGETSAMEPAAILDLACGECHEAEMLVRLFRDLRNGESNEPSGSGSNDGGEVVRLFGMDVRGRELDRARERCRTRADDDAGTEIVFLDGDARRVTEHRELPGEFDVVFLRHQNYWHDETIWKRIFEKALEKLAPEGRLIITSYFDEEHRRATAVLTGAGAELLETEKNVESRLLDQRLRKSVDRHIATFRKK